MKSLLIVAACLFAVGSARAQIPMPLPPTVSVVDVKGAPMAGVRLSGIAGWGRSEAVVATGTTDRRGRFDFGTVNLAPGKVIAQIVATAPGCGLEFARVFPNAPLTPTEFKESQRSS